MPLRNQLTVSDLPPVEFKLPWVDEAEIAHAYPVLFHYTQEKHFQSILQSGGLFASDYRQTNDPHELLALRNSLALLMAQGSLPLLRYAKDIGNFQPPDDWDLEKVAIEEAKSFYDIMVQALPTSPHLTCFSGYSDKHQMRNGLLTMWRLYGREGGIALGFKTAKLIQNAEELTRSCAIESLYLDQVLYGWNHPIVIERVFQAPFLFRKFADYLVLMLQKRSPELRFSGTEFFALLNLVCGVKLADFGDEREVRLIATPSIPGRENGRESIAEAKPGRLVIRYLDALEQVLVGPGADQANSEIKIRRMLADHGLPNVEVVRSDIQFAFG